MSPASIENIEDQKDMRFNPTLKGFNSGSGVSPKSGEK